MAETDETAPQTNSAEEIPETPVDPNVETPEAPIAEEVHPLNEDTQEKSQGTITKTETLELAGRKRSSLSKQRALSLTERRQSLKDDTRRVDSISSRAKLVLGSTISIKKSDTVGDIGSERRRSARLMNTYRLESDRPFNAEKVEKILEEILVEALEGPYDEVKCPQKAKQASAAIRDKVKELDFERYKLVCIVTIGEKHNQDVMVACRFLWDVERDRFAMFSHETCHVYGVALCFGLYYE